MRRIKLLFPILLVALFAGSTFAQTPRSIDLEKVKMNADIAKELSSIIKANKVALKTMSAKEAKSQKLEWREELREMFGWYNDRPKEDKSYIKEQLKLAKVREQKRVKNKEKKYVTVSNVVATTYVGIPVITQNNAGQQKIGYQVFATSTSGISGQKLPQGAVVVNVNNPVAANLGSNPGPLSQAQALSLLKGQQQGLKAAYNQTKAAPVGQPNADDSGATGSASQASKLAFIKQLNESLDGGDVVIPDNQINGNAPKIDPSDLPQIADADKVKCSKPAQDDFGSDEAGYMLAIKAYQKCREKNGQNTFLTITTTL